MTIQARALAGDRPGDLPITRRDSRPVAVWLLVICGMMLVMVTLGGATRITGSGLSIMEWAPVSGALPPLSQQEWERLFALYQGIPQYSILNHGFSLAEFKGIFWLEWVHRLWGRLIGVAFLGPFLWFWATGRFDARLWLRLGLIFLLGGLQGAVGWFMVASGYFPDSTAVSPYRLVIHLAFALLLYAAILWTALSLLRPRPSAPPSARLARGLCIGCCILVGLTIVAGGFVAGTHAGLDYNTFPLMEGRLVPAGYGSLHPFLLNWVENIAAVQFNHRILATTTVILGAATAVAAFAAQVPHAIRWSAAALGLVSLLQYSLGVTTLLNVVPPGLAIAHQALATLVLTAALVCLHALRPDRLSKPLAVQAAE